MCATRSLPTLACGLGEHYGTVPRTAGRLRAEMILAASKAVTMDIGLIATFGGIGVIVNLVLVIIAIQVRGERRENREYRERLLEQ
jgi:hypothetical protein